MRLPEFLDIRHMEVVRLSPYGPAAFTPMRYFWHSFLVEVESTPGPQCGQLSHRESNPRPSRLYRSALTNFAKLYPLLQNIFRKYPGYDVLMTVSMVIKILRGVAPCTDIRRLTTGIPSEKCVVRRFRRSANVIECTYTNLDSIVYCTPRLYGIAYCS